MTNPLIPNGPIAKASGATRLVSWNINSVRARLALVEKFIENYDPDIICLQEIKANNDVFPAKFFKKLGFSEMAVRGQKGHHGVATLMRETFKSDDHINWCQKGDARHVSIKMNNGIEVHNFYVPAGGDEPNADINEKFAHKMDFMDEMKTWGENIQGPSIVVGDLNVAPLETDVWDHKKLIKIVSHTPLECEKLKAIQASHGWVDAMRKFIPDDEKLFTWWSYRAKDWRNANKGRRLDHIWVSPELEDKLLGIHVITDARGWEKPSDHAPVIVDMAL
jgi:exodeoxyribonuclease-3